jgi:hypothetical protein
VDMSLLALAGIAILYTLLILVSVKYNLPSSKAVHTFPQIAESNFALKEGQTIVGVMDTTQVMRFYIDHDVRDEKNCEEPQG